MEVLMNHVIRFLEVLMFFKFCFEKRLHPHIILNHVKIMQPKA